MESEVINQKDGLPQGVPQLKKKLTAERVLLRLLHVFSSLSFPIAFLLYIVVTIRFQGDYRWIVLLHLPIPLASFIVGVIYMRKPDKQIGNFVVGIVFTSLMLYLAIALYRGIGLHRPPDTKPINETGQLPQTDFFFDSENRLRTNAALCEYTGKLRRQL